jgi:hypothetical protein
MDGFPDFSAIQDRNPRQSGLIEGGDIIRFCEIKVGPQRQKKIF